MTSLSIVVFTSILLLSSSVNAFISTTSNQPIKNTHISTSLLSAYIDENYPHAATTTRGVKESETINGNNSKEQKQPTTNNTKRPSKTLPNGAKLTLVGAGPGSPDLLTLAAHKIITNPNNYLIVDRLVSQEILDLIQGEYRVANKYRGCADIAQEEIYDWCKDGLREGKHVVRYFCSRNKLTIDPISGDTFPIKSLLGKAGSMPNPLNWSNYNEEQKNSWTTPTTNIKKQCLEFGFKEGTEKFADCQLKIYTLQNQ